MESTPSNGSGARARTRNPSTSQTKAPRDGQTDGVTRAQTRAKRGAQKLAQIGPQGAPLPFDTYPAIAIESVYPEIDGGRWPIKRVVGDAIAVEADIFKEGHDLLTAQVLYQEVGAPAWQEVPMMPTINDRWRGEFKVDRNARYVYTIQAFTDVYGSWRADLMKRTAAAQDVTSELLEGLRQVEAAAERATDPDDRGRLRAYVQRWRDFRGSTAMRDAAELAISAELADVMDRWPDKSDATRYRHALQLTVDRPEARFAAWYEIFPRSQGTDSRRSATFREAEARIPAIAAMGFNVLYMTPIHPIGHTNRKGPNNTLVAGPSDPGSPYAIGSEAGGHEAIAPELGTIDDFLHFQQVAREHGLELAMDFAIQVSPDHPWVTEHPEWFYHRPDGTIKYAENPPKKYEDIYPLNFRGPDWKNLWTAWRDLVMLWAERGVRIFRVDNPHTKPLAFWEWMIRDVQSVYPGAIFLAEAFTRPKMMKALAKLGFTQSYTYFTWRNARWELIEYLTELTQTEMREYYRANFFANTPDILPRVLQLGGRPAFRMRLALAATLSPVYGIYSGFELCENRPRGADSEYYLDSEMYQHKVWDWHRPGNIIDDVTRINHMRRNNPALQLYDNLRFVGSDNEQIIAYTKVTPNRDNVIVCIVNLDPYWPQSAWIEVPAHEWGVSGDQPYVVHDLMNDERYTWRGNYNWVRLDPHVQPAHVFRIEVPR
jgi:starch synthase (maltosyl-transferring)